MALSFRRPTLLDDNLRKCQCHTTTVRRSFAETLSTTVRTCHNQCTNQNLELFSKALYPIRYMASLYLFIAGCIIAGNIHLAQGFGRGMTAIGAFLIVCCFWNLGSSTLMHAGMKRHNKCITLAVRCIRVFFGAYRRVRSVCLACWHAVVVFPGLFFLAVLRRHLLVLLLYYITCLKLFTEVQHHVQDTKAVYMKRSPLISLRLRPREHAKEHVLFIASSACNVSTLVG